MDGKGCVKLASWWPRDLQSAGVGSQSRFAIVAGLANAQSALHGDEFADRQRRPWLGPTGMTHVVAA